MTEVMSACDGTGGPLRRWPRSGARNMQNYRLLEEVGDYGKPVLLKRGPSRHS